MEYGKLVICTRTVGIQGAPKIIIPQEKFDISGIVVIFFIKFTVFREEDSCHISCTFHCNISLHLEIVNI